MLVCRHWHTIILSTPGLHSQLTIRRATQKEVVRAFIHARKTRLGVTIDVNDEGDGNDFDAENFRACFMAAIQAASRWSSLDLISPPPHGEYKDLQIFQPLTHLQSIKFVCGSGEFIEQLVTAISRNAPPNLTAMVLADPAAVLCLGQPACSHIYHSLTTLEVQLLKRMDSPVDILPHLHSLETLEASRLCLPLYPPDSALPLVHTLRFLYLKSVSVHWMAGRVFPALEKCSIIFPHHTDTFHASQPVTMPSCSSLLYNSNDLHPLAQFHLPSLDALDVKNAQWNVWRGNPHFASLYPIFATTPQCLTLLRLDVQCSERLLVYMLRLAPVLEDLWLGLARPNVLGKTFCQAFITRELHADCASEVIGPPSHTITPLCPSLKSLHLHYRKWMRGPDKNSLVVAFGDIVESRKLVVNPSFSLKLSFDEAPEESHWTIGMPVRKIHNFEDGDLILGISTPHTIIPMSTLLPERGLVQLPFKKAESLHLLARDPTFLEFLPTHDHTELRVHDYGRPEQRSSLPCALPLFYALRVLDLKCDDPSFLAGHTFHNLERCRLLKVNWFIHIPGERILTEIRMPVCTRVDIDDPWVLASFKLPDIHELALDFSVPYCSAIWGKYIAVNANLLGLNLLQMKNWPQGGDLTAILKLAPLLETLIISTWAVESALRAFLPMDTNGTSGLKRTSSQGKTLTMLCPRLRHLQMENEYFEAYRPLIAIAKNVITLRAKRGSLLKVIAFSPFRSKRGRKVELIGMGGNLTTGESVLDKGTKGFKLDI